MELYCKSRTEWREWLEKNHQTVDGVWLVYYKKHSGKPRIPYRDAVEEALCYGWIDGKIKRMNDVYYVQWFTPRRPGSRWSKHNMDIAESLIKKELMRPAGLIRYQKALDKPQLIYDNRAESNPDIPVDLLNALKNGKSAYDNFISYPPSGRRMCIYWLNSAKRADTRLRRIQKILEIAEKNIRPGMITLE
jgi:uncharacterized protein YdeI (YjbR/CyaY-like superfamily)